MEGFKSKYPSIVFSEYTNVFICCSELGTKKNYFVTFCATVKTITPSVLWMTGYTEGSSVSGHPHRGGDSYSFTVAQKGMK